MGIVKKVMDKYEENQTNKLSDRLIKIHRRNNLSFNPLSVGMTVDLLSDKTFSARMLENFVWYSASIPLLRQFYYKNQITENVFGNDDANFFWRRAPEKFRKVHSKLPSIITDKMVDLTFGKGVHFNIEIINEEGEPIEVETEKANKIFDYIKEDNDLVSLLKEGESNRSWAGGVAMKICVDTEVSNVPIVQFEDGRKVEVVSKRDRIVEIIFKRHYSKGKNGKDKYKLEEIYSTNEYGKATIRYQLMFLDRDHEWKKVPLDSIEETKDLEDYKVFENVNGMIAFYIPNKKPNKEFVGSIYGESDYAGCTSYFDSVDEVLSTMLEETRRNKTKFFIPTYLIPKDDEGKIIGFDDFQLNYIQVDNEGLEENKKIDVQKNEFKPQPFLDELKELFVNIFNIVGLAPSTIGMTGLEGINTSDGSQREREKTTLRTRDTKLVAWRNILPKLAKGLLDVYKEMEIDGITPKHLESFKGSIDASRVSVDFPEYTIKTVEERLKEFGEARVNNAISIDELVNQVYKGKKTDEEIKEEIDKIKMELNLTIDDADRDLLAE